MTEQEWRYVLVEEGLEKPSLKSVCLVVFITLLTAFLFHFLHQMTLKQFLVAVVLCCSVQYVRLVYLTVKT